MQSGKAASGSSSELKAKVFNSADQNGDGGISKDELTALMSDSSQSATDIAETFDALDTNQDGSISKSESDAAVDKAGQQRKAQGPPPPPPPSDSSSSESTSSNTIFDELDTNEDGTVSASELLAAFSNGDNSSASGSSEDIKQLFDAMDTNKDGSVSKSELAAALAEAGKQSDTQGTSTANASAGAAKGEDSARFAAAIKSYMQASMSSFAESSTAATFSSTAVYG